MVHGCQTVLWFITYMAGRACNSVMECISVLKDVWQTACLQNCLCMVVQPTRYHIIAGASTSKSCIGLHMPPGRHSTSCSKSCSSFVCCSNFVGCHSFVGEATVVAAISTVATLVAALLAATAATWLDHGLDLLWYFITGIW